MHAASSAFRPALVLLLAAVFTVTGANYEFDTSTDLKTWTPISQVPGANVLYEFRDAPPTGESARFYRVSQKIGP